MNKNQESKSSNLYTDVNVLLGHWPFRRIRKNTLADLQQIHGQHQVATGYVASMNSIFYNDPFEGDLELHEQIGDTNYKHVLTINPTLPGWKRDIEEGVRRFKIQAVRIYPTYHRYKMCSKEVSELCDVLRLWRLPLFVTIRLEDERLEYVYQSVPLDMEDLQQFVSNEAELDIVLLNLRFREVMLMKDEIRQQARVYFDTSGLKDRVFVLQEIQNFMPLDKILFGSEYPLYTFKSTISLVEMADISETDKQKILSENVKGLVLSSSEFRAKI